MVKEWRRKKAPTLHPLCMVEKRSSDSGRKGGLNGKGALTKSFPNFTRILVHEPKQNSETIELFIRTTIL